jgi:hypothetical protein
MGPRPWADAVARANAAAKQPILLIHDPRLTNRMWTPWTEVLDGAGYLTLTLPLPPGPGVDPDDERPWALDATVGHFSKIAQALSSRPAVVGLARGGTVARRLAEARLSAATVVIVPEPHVVADDERAARPADADAALLTLALDRDDKAWRSGAEAGLNFLQGFV